MPGWLAAASLVVAALGVLGVVVLFARGAFLTQKVAELRADLADLRGERDDADRRADRAEHDRDAADERLKAAKTRIQVLTEAVTQQAAVQALADALREHRVTVEKRHTHHDAQETQILKKVDEVLRIVRGRQ